MEFEKVEAVFDDEGNRSLVPTNDEPVIIECDDVLVAIGQDNSFEWIERDIGLKFGEWDMPVVDAVTFQSTHPKVFFGGDAAWGPENIIWAAAHGHQAAISIHKFCQNEDITSRRRVHLGGDWRKPCRFLPNLRAGCAIYEIGRGK